MFELFKRKDKPRTVLDEFIFSIYGNPPPAKRANLNKSISLAKELLLEKIDELEITRHATSLNDSPIPYSTHDLALSVAISFLKQPEYVNDLFQAQLNLRLSMIEWLQQGLISPKLAENYENLLYRLDALS